MKQINTIRILLLFICGILYLTTARVVDGQTDLVEKMTEVGNSEPMNLNYPGLNKVKKQVAKKEWVDACKTLIYYYRKKSDHYPRFGKHKISNFIFWN